ncbi:MAG: hypothetical protein A2X42_12375 [Candidatus Margulisbacteria bacterium GWF2_38_17]|nr:MAG: hypothetical protein A2X42_12375 [Candidatus Margulisbacteria bacterium GWF2_38_17]OGI09600.1 MAG: hypothetical protein A2X41_06580 [Candidatus Margulisbacteria bacterium GWE2_39_32]
MVKIIDILSIARENNAYHIQLIAGYKPVFRINGENNELEGFETLTANDSEQYFRECLEIVSCSSIKKDYIIQQFENHKNTNFSIEFKDVGRFRINVHIQKQTIALSIRVIPLDIPSPEQLNLPQLIYELCELEQGLIVVTGPSCHGKTTTIAAMINMINRNQNKHIITIEDPIEFVYENMSSYIQQRELGIDCNSISSALKNSLQQNPDIIFVGELNSPEVIEAAINASQAGHLVLSTICTNDVVQTIDHIISLFPSNEQSKIRQQLSGTLAAVICQRLVPSLALTRILTTEVLRTNYSVQSIIKSGQLQDLYKIIETSIQEGMHLFSQDLMSMVHKQMISFQTAIKYCNDKNYFEKIAHELLKDN